MNEASTQNNFLTLFEVRILNRKEGSFSNYPPPHPPHPQPVLTSFFLCFNATLGRYASLPSCPFDHLLPPLPPPLLLLSTDTDYPATSKSAQQHQQQQQQQQQHHQQLCLLLASVLLLIHLSRGLFYSTEPQTPGAPRCSAPAATS